jgi:hypothetical protein
MSLIKRIIFILISLLIPVGGGGAYYWWANQHFECMVVDKKDESRLRGVTVTITSRKNGNEQPQTQKTGNEGKAPFDTPDFSGEVIIRAEKDGYAPHEDHLNPGWKLDSRLTKITLEKRVAPPPDHPCKENPDLEWCKITEPGEDQNGNSADFTFRTLIGTSARYRWTYGSSEKIDIDRVEKKETKNALELLDSEVSRLKIDSDEEIIGVGSASCEGGKKTEQKRSRDRANVIIKSVKKYYSNDSYMLVLGKYNDKECMDKNPELTSSQRSVIIITFKNIKEINKNKPFDPESATKSAFKKVLKNPEFAKALRKNFQNKSKNPLGKEININHYEDFYLTQ